MQFLGRELVAAAACRALLLYLLGLAGEIFVLTSIYLVMPVGACRCGTR